MNFQVELNWIGRDPTEWGDSKERGCSRRLIANEEGEGMFKERYLGNRD